MENNLEKDNEYHSPSEFWLRQQAEIPPGFFDGLERMKESLTADIQLYGAIYNEKIQEKVVNDLWEEQRRSNVVKRLWRRIQGIFKKQ